MSINRCQDNEAVVYTHSMECYSVIKNDGIIPFGRKCMEVEMIMPSEIVKYMKDNYGIVSVL